MSAPNELLVAVGEARAAWHKLVTDPNENAAYPRYFHEAMQRLADAPLAGEDE